MYLGSEDSRASIDRQFNKAQKNIAANKLILCPLCGKPFHNAKYHDNAIVDWLEADKTGARRYYAYKRTEKKDYKGFRADVYWMMHHSPADW